MKISQNISPDDIVPALYVPVSNFSYTSVSAQLLSINFPVVNVLHTNLSIMRFVTAFLTNQRVLTDNFHLLRALTVSH